MNTYDSAIKAAAYNAVYVAALEADAAARAADDAVRTAARAADDAVRTAARAAAAYAAVRAAYAADAAARAAYADARDAEQIAK